MVLHGILLFLMDHALCWIGYGIGLKVPDNKHFPAMNTAFF